MDLESLTLMILSSRAVQSNQPLACYIRGNCFRQGTSQLEKTHRVSGQRDPRSLLGFRLCALFHVCIEGQKAP